MPPIPALFFAIALGQLCAIGLHAWTWRLRQRAIWSLALIGILGAELFFLAIIIGCGAMAMEMTHPKSRADLLESAEHLGLLLFGGAIPPAIGFLHAWQLQGHGRPTCEGWDSATLSVFGELSIAALSLLALTFFNAVVPIMDNDSGLLFGGTFIITVLVVMIFRPVALKFLRLFMPLIKSLRENLRLLHPKVRGDIR